MADRLVISVQYLIQCSRTAASVQNTNPTPGSYLPYALIESDVNEEVCDNVLDTMVNSFGIVLAPTYRKTSCIGSSKGYIASITSFWYEQAMGYGIKDPLRSVFLLGKMS